MTFWTILSAILAPALFWIAYFKYKDRYKPEPFINLGMAFLFGMIFGLLCFKFHVLLEFIGIPRDPSAFVYNRSGFSFIYLVSVVGFVEELFKLIPFIFIVRYFRNFDEIVDGIIYSSIIALGFAGFENILFIPYLSGIELFGRAIASPLTHTLFSSIWGYYIARSKLSGRIAYGKITAAFIISILLHGIYDFFTISSAYRIISTLVILIIWIWRIIIIEKGVVE
ncbi:MAG: PrsW family glutamic-type intramembrane protease [Acidobacteriota bacterium]